MSDPSTIHVLRLANVDYVTLNRPEVRNAFNEHLIAEMTAWAEGAARDASLRGAVIGGAGKSFCAGADVAWMAKMARLRLAYPKIGLAVRRVSRTRLPIRHGRTGKARW